MQRLGPKKKRKRKCSECVEYFGHWAVLMCGRESGLCIRDRGLIVDDQQKESVSPNKSLPQPSSVKQRLGPKKKEKEMQLVFWGISVTGLSLCIEQRVHFVQEMIDWKLTHKGVSFTRHISSLVLICDAKTWSQKNRIRKCSEYVEYFGHWTVLMCWTESGLCTRVRELIADHQQKESVSPNKSLP